MNHTDDRLRAAAQRALASLCDLILDTPDPSPEVTAARLQLEEALAAAPAVVAPPTSRAAVLLDAAATYEEILENAPDHSKDPRYWTAVRDVVMGLRRLAAEAQQQCPGIETVPNRCTCDCEGCKHHCGAHNPTDPPHVRAARYAAAGNEMAASLVRDGFGDDEITEILDRPASEQPAPADGDAPRP